ncbi:hypothetical protein NE237_030438 [Protea cynaroides]|uniref:J domain-containing protein n=1 Tax=Protea cynaroides TaxID=273540 RepID=A0A9Q0GV36_9MAGN|nr:hypothetical protein NE237_030438 [Protea cynaroides]
MAAGEEKSPDFYAVLGLKKECTASELRNAYKKLALRWHPDRCSATGNSKHVEEAKEKFQSIQDAYSVLSDTNKRFLYDVGAYDDDENGMGDFLGEMAFMMRQANPSEKGQESFEDLQELFQEMFERDIDAFTSAASSSFGKNHNDKSNENKRSCGSRLSSERSSSLDAESMDIPSFCIGAEGREDCQGKRGKGRRKSTCRKQKPKIGGER